MDEGLVRGSECQREVDEFVAISEQWRYWSDGCGELLAFCAECSKREFAPDAPASGLASRILRRGADRSDG